MFISQITALYVSTVGQSIKGYHCGRMPGGSDNCLQSIGQLRCFSFWDTETVLTGDFFLKTEYNGFHTEHELKCDKKHFNCL